MNKKPMQNKWLIAILIAALVVMAAVVVAIVAGSAPQPPVVEAPLTEGLETGVYYYDTPEGEVVSTRFSAARKGDWLLVTLQAECHEQIARQVVLPQP